MLRGGEEHLGHVQHGVGVRSTGEVQAGEAEMCLVEEQADDGRQLG